MRSSLALLVALSIVACKKDNTDFRMHGDFQFQVSADRLPNGDADLMLYALDEHYKGAEVTVLGHTWKHPAHGTIPFAELKPGINKLEAKATFSDELSTDTGAKTFEFDAYPSSPAIAWDTAGTFVAGSDARPTVHGELDADGNFVAHGKTEPNGAFVVEGGKKFTADASGAIAIAFPLLAKVAARAIWESEYVELDYTYDHAGVKKASISFYNVDLVKHLMLASFKKPVVFPGDAAPAKPRGIYDGGAAHVIGNVAKITDLDLVARKGLRKKKLSNCVYQGNFVVERSAEYVDVEVVDRRTGKSVAKKTFAAKSGEACPDQIKVASTQRGSEWMQGPEPADIEAWLTALVK